jgi:glycosyltransferase involved in cell wall biosynthesis
VAAELCTARRSGRAFPLRITYLHQYFATGDSSTGTRSLEFARRLVDAGHEVTMVTSDANLSQSMSAEGGIRRDKLDGISLLVIGVAYSNDMSYRRRILSFFHFAARASWHASRVEVDVIFATSTPLTIAIPALIARLVQGAPLVFEVRDLWPEVPIAMGALRNPVTRFLAEALEWLAYHGSRQIIALSPGIADGVAKRGVPRSRITMIPNGCDNGFFDAPGASGDGIRASVPDLGSVSPLILYAGALGAVNGVSYLAEIAAEMRSLVPGARFLVYGGGHEKQGLLSRASELGVLDETFFVRDALPKRSMPSVFAAATATVSVFVPVKELEANSANKFFDSLAAGRPVIINYGGWLADLLQESGAGIVVPGEDAKGAAVLIASFVTDPGRLSRACLAAKELARERFDRDLLASVFIDVFERVHGEKPRSRNAR